MNKIRVYLFWGILNHVGDHHGDHECRMIFCVHTRVDGFESRKRVSVHGYRPALSHSVTVGCRKGFQETKSEEV